VAAAFLNDPAVQANMWQAWRRQLKLFTSIQIFQYKPAVLRGHRGRNWPSGQEQNNKASATAIQQRHGKTKRAIIKKSAEIKAEESKSRDISTPCKGGEPEPSEKGAWAGWYVSRLRRSLKAALKKRGSKPASESQSLNTLQLQKRTHSHLILS